MIKGLNKYEYIKSLFLKIVYSYRNENILTISIVNLIVEISIIIMLIRLIIFY